MKKNVKFQNDDFDYDFDSSYNFTYENTESDISSYQNDWQQNDSTLDDDLLSELGSLDTYRDNLY